MLANIILSFKIIFFWFKLEVGLFFFFSGKKLIILKVYHAWWCLNSNLWWSFHEFKWKCISEVTHPTWCDVHTQSVTGPPWDSDERGWARICSWPWCGWGCWALSEMEAGIKRRCWWAGTRSLLPATTIQPLPRGGSLHGNFFVISPVTSTWLNEGLS